MNESGSGPATGHYQFGYVVSSPSDIQAQVFSGESHTYVSLPSNIQLQAATGGSGLQSPARKGPYWVVNGLSTQWSFATTRGVVNATATGAARQMALVSGAQATIANTMPVVAQTPAAPVAIKNTKGKTALSQVAGIKNPHAPITVSPKRNSPSVPDQWMHPALQPRHHSEVFFIPGAEGRIMPLQRALFHIVPEGWQTHISKYISPTIPVTWHKGLWTTSLNRMAKSDAWVAHINFEKRSILIDPTPELLVGIPGISNAKEPLATVPSNSTITDVAMPQQSNGEIAKGHNIGETTISSTGNLPINSLAHATPVFILNRGDLILTDLQKWAKQAAWTVIWQVPEDWQVPNTTTFSGDFQKAVSQVIQALSANGANVHAVFHTANNTVVISGAGGGE
ncbi:MAG: toxin co-regulated pilus biosynthesis Q family protein [Acidithiobacillus sp.]|nr:toxin co-regulated pilus biosynthesis Q family protein [Acidithiobacillus sp.]